MKLLIFLLFISSITISLSCDFNNYNGEWLCLPCGGIYSCTGSGTCFANPSDISSQCKLPSDASDWMCCQSDTCSISGTGLCTYTPPTTSTSTSTEEPSCDHIQCPFYQSCQCVCVGCSGVGLGCFECKTQSWFIALMEVISSHPNQSMAKDRIRSSKQREMTKEAFINLNEDDVIAVDGVSVVDIVSNNENNINPRAEVNQLVDNSLAFIN
ncbi:hypothetical protein PPL_10892 [Heterostelium album PN500]|uniref:Uncharacterized protein n=1 Tax=Heterostelium pallidum (strain ATCC 26659 / Pp 5 / PN500) TaxID=670386 RepID=D3BSA0_HETP5|nr:hypothetical protein PPL_10892 [Heterostelium album PN500]EFA75837.1 hypothetical protein PPL_10892 [Heterostelium album PN500]|eukprot:XP_020427971.1 hypothetical protein PPL_10892 [Heterostelium album PN500]